MRFSLSSLLLLLLPLSSDAVSTPPSGLTITLPSSINPNSLPSSTYATLTTISQPNGPLKAPLSQLSTFVFDDLSISPTSKTPHAPISYLLDIHSRNHVFAPYRVDVSPETGKIIGVWETYRGHPWNNKGPEKILPGEGYTPGVVVVEAKVLGKKEFYEQREKFSILSLLKNPMLLLAIFALGVTFGMPYLLDSMDPETREEFEKQRAAKRSSTNNATPGFDLAGWMAGTNPNLIETSQPASSTGAEQGSPAASIRRRG